MADPQQAPQFGGDNALADKIRAKFPGAYNDMSDAQLAAAVVTKYPQYKDLSLPYDMKVKRGDQWVPVRSETATPDERTHGIEYHPPDTYSLKNTYEGAKTGAMVAGLPLMLGASAPQLIGGLVGGAAGTAGGRAIASTAGAGEFGQEVAGDVGGLAGGAGGGLVADRTSAAAKALYEILPESLQDALKRHAIGLISPRTKNALDLASAVRDAIPSKATFPGAPLPEHPGVFPGAPNPAMPAPEQLNPSLISQARTLPGQISPEVVRPPVSTAQPIPPRQGLALPAAESPESRLPAAFQPLPQQPTPLQGPTGTVGNPFQGPGEAGSMAQSVVQPTPVSKQVLESQLNDALGGRGLKPGVPLKNQLDIVTPKAPSNAQGFTPVESSAITAYKYDPEAQEFHTITKSGTQYIHGDVTPDQVQAFEDAKSKGAAWGKLKDNSTLVAKVINGKRMPVRPPTELQSASPEAAPVPVKSVSGASNQGPKAPEAQAQDDLEDILQESLRRVRASKAQ